MLRAVVFVVVSLKLQENNVNATSVLLKNSYNCPNAPNPMPVTLDATLIRTFPNHSQLLDVNFNVPFPMDSNTLANAKIEYNTFGSTWMQVASFDDKKGACNLFTVSGGDMWVDFQKAAGMTPKACPIPQGKHHASHMILNLTKQKISTIPPGNYRLTLELREKSNNRVLLCKMFDIEDKA